MIRTAAIILMSAAITLAASTAQSDDGNLCDISENDFVIFAGGAAAGTALSASFAGESIVIIITQGAVLVGTAPAIAPAVTLAAGSAAIAYGTLKAYCGRHDVTDQVMTWYQASVDNTSDGMDIAVQRHGELVNYTSRVFEGVATTRSKASEAVTDWLCRVTGNC